jgi:hypothetical protein
MGRLPELVREGDSERAYEPIQSREEMQAAISGMHMLRELRDDPHRGERDSARECLRASTGKLIFLGFAYAQENLEALDLANTRGAKQAYGTIFGIDEDERANELKDRLKLFDVALSEPWPFTVHQALLTRPTTIFGTPRQ